MEARLMTIKHATPKELNDVEDSLQLALDMAYNMLMEIGRGNQFDNWDYRNRVLAIEYCAHAAVLAPGCGPRPFYVD